MVHLAPIGVVRSCFRQKFGIPRQPGLAPAARATLELLPPYNQPAAVRGLEGFSHVWLVFVFHGIPAGRWQPTVRPPRLGGNRRLGVFATRSTFRPNPLGLSAVRLERVTIERGSVILHLAGIDLLDGTPVLDLKPYVPYADCIPTATGGFASDAPPSAVAVEFSPAALAVCATWREGDLRELIAQLLSQDPRPAYEGIDPAPRPYGMKLLDFDVRWEMRGAMAYVTEIAPTLTPPPTPATGPPPPADRLGSPHPTDR
ncbi:MAG: tRNA (N6-threonylcarbamoyladenosine(37)-N6)-methyltransferase TrmO [Candidatus Competibacteraceae bacterium]|nr:tRNA (N6-threonylcarbamoyladenosine(37)-N6)-methyltransferase TrmO [Candidatus Competibacteraceae bacterium]MBK9952156.1 tRNA (N6-threonylcarbamoyladenosine(37)-N6)-methyltransferase TrmO [Candidatus Competibacteraceae bacterium]